MRIALAGCSGFVGGELVPRLEQRGVSLLLIGRDPAALARRFPNHEVCDYDALSTAARGCDCLINLAARNNDRGWTRAELDAINVDFMLDLQRRAEQAGVRRFVNLSSFHALAVKPSPYGASKRKAESRLAEQAGCRGLSLRVPAVYGDRCAGALRIVERLPRFAAPVVFSILAAMRPTLHADRLARFLVEEALEYPAQAADLSDAQQDNRVYALTQRCLDLCFALAVVVLGWWLLALVWLAVRLESAGTGIFAQVRVGRFGRPFVCYKFRTMAQGTRQAGTHEVNAAAVTKVGAVLRRTKIDELPQAINLFRNEISLIGPRPCLPVQHQLVAARQRAEVLSINPGITGLAQINDIDMSRPALLAEWDRRYLMTRCIPLDLSIVLRTFIGRGQGDRTAG